MTNTAAPGADTRSEDGWMSREEAIMGTAIRVELWHEDHAKGVAAMAAVMDEMHRIDVAMSPFKPESELSRVNREAAAAPVPITAELYSLLERSLAFSCLSGGAFDISFASVGSMFDYRRGIKPSDAAIAEALPAISYEKLLLDPAARTIRFAMSGMQIDLGGIAKGHAVDNAIRLLRERGVRHALVMAGGDSRVLGDRRGRPWMIGVRHPRREAMAAMIPLVDAAISTSGDYERYFELDGVRHHHIIDPRTGRSADGMHSVTIIGPDATTTEGLSKCLFVLGVKKGMALIASWRDVDAIVIDAAGDIHYSPGLQQAQSMQ